MDWICDNNVKVDHWRKDTTYDKFIKQHALKESCQRALEKFVFTPKKEYFLLFISSYNLSCIGKDSIDFLNELPLIWSGEIEKYKNFVGIILPEYEKTHFLRNHNCDLELTKLAPNLLNYHDYYPTVLKN